jgi:hypothetical protein
MNPEIILIPVIIGLAAVVIWSELRGGKRDNDNDPPEK